MAQGNRPASGRDLEQRRAVAVPIASAVPRASPAFCRPLRGPRLALCLLGFGLAVPAHAQLDNVRIEDAFAVDRVTDDRLRHSVFLRVAAILHYTPGCTGAIIHDTHAEVS